MVKIFQNAKEFIEFKQNCIFCNNKLKPILSNFTVMSGMPSVMSNYDGNTFSFHINYNTALMSIDCGASLDCETNKIDFSEITPTNPSKVREAFDFMKLHIELCCTNKLCKNKDSKLRYYVSSDALELSNFHVSHIYNPNVESSIIKPIKLYMECFKLGGLIIQNDYHKSVTNIYSINRSGASPIQMPILDFTAFDKEKLFNKILTYVNFS